MDLEQAFLDDTVAHPHDPTPWLVFADWLAERDDPRGELVRLLRLCWDEPRSALFKERHARLQDLFAAGVTVPLPRFTSPAAGTFVWVPPGTGWLGGVTSPGRRKVTIAQPFWLGVYPVTQAQWRAVDGTNPAAFARRGSQARRVTDLADADLDRLPVECVSWRQAEAFVALLNELEPGHGYRLPTADEWEFATRSPVTCRDDCAFAYHFASPAHDLSPELANFGGHVGRTTVVGSYPPNRLGIFDLHGNVFEWTATVQGDLAIVHGGAWNLAAGACRASNRGRTNRGSTFTYVGLRLATTAGLRRPLPAEGRVGYHAHVRPTAPAELP